MADSLALVWDLIARDNASATFRKVGAEAEGASGAVGKLLGGFTALAVGGAIAVATKAAADFQAKMLLIQTQAGATSDEVRKMSPAILTLAGQVAQAPEALATSLYHVESTGLRGAQALEAVRIAAEGAKVGHADLEETTNALTATIASGMLPATETYSQAMGQLNTIVGSGDMKMQDLNDALGTGLLVTMKQYGVTIPDVGAALADFGDNNIRGADAATKLRMAVQAIESPARGGQAALEKIGITSSQLAQDMATGGLNKALTDLHDHLVNSGIDASQWGQILTDAFTKKAGSGVLTLIGTFDRFQQKYKEVSDGANSFGDAWAATTKTASFQFSALGNSMEALGIKIGTAVLPYVTSLAQHINDFVNSQGFQDFLSRVGDAALTAGHAIGGLVQGFMGLPAPIQEAAAALVLLRLADHIGLLDKLSSGTGKVTGAFGALRQEMQLQQALYGMQRTGLGDVDRALGGLGASSDNAVGGFGRLRASAATLADKGFGALKSGATGLMGMFGGPWGIALVGATVGVGALQSAIQKHDEAIKRATDDVMAWNRAVALNPGGKAAVDAQQHIADLQNQVDTFQKAVTAGVEHANEGYGRSSGYAAQHLKELRDELARGKQQWADQLAAMTPVEEMQARVDAATKDLTDAQKNNASNSPAVTNAAMRLQEAQHMLAAETVAANAATKTQAQLQQDAANAMLASLDATRAADTATMQAADSVDQYNKDLAAGALQGETAKQTQRRLAEELNGVVASQINAAKAAADAAETTDKQNGITDTAKDRQAALLKSLQASADNMTGPGKQAILDYIAQLGKQQSQAVITSGAISALGVTVTSLPSEHLIQINAPTAQQEKDLHDLGYVTTHLPNGQVVVTADTHPALTEIQDLLNYARQQSIQFRAGLAITNPLGGTSQRMGTYATGGYTGDGAKYTPAGIVHAGEFVFPQESVKKLGVGFLGALAGLPGYAAGGPVVIPASIDQASLTAMRGQLGGLAQQAGSYLSAPGAGAGAARWRGVVDSVLRALGLPLSVDSGVLSLIQAESGGNPNAINLTDSNARAGHPSQGLMQTIPGTFRAYAGPYASRGITDPFANIYAGVNYALNTYGLGMLAAGGRHNSMGRYIGYETGTNYVPNDGPAYLHKGEAVIPAAINARMGNGPVQITGRLEIGGDGMATLIGEVLDMATDRGAYNG